MSLTLTSPAFTPSEKIPLRYSGEGEDVSPPLAWNRLPPGTAQLALICDDPDAGPTPWVHWLIYGLSPQLTELPEGIPASPETAKPVACQQGKNSWGGVGWRGPYPPKGGGMHHYHFTLYALSRPIETQPGLEKPALLRAMQGAIVGQATLTGLYER